MSDSPMWPLSGLRVIDLSTQISGPYATKLMVDAGAEVIKIEAPEVGDPLRRWSASGQEPADGESGLLFQYLNASKKSVVLDLDRSSDRDTLLDLIAGADIVVESFAPGTLDALGLSFESMQTRNPQVSLVSISPWGQTGPWKDRPSTEFTLQAQVGSIGYRGLRDRKPVCAGGRLGEWATAPYAAVGGLCAWLSSRATGAGQHVDVSMFEAILLSMTIYHDLNGQWVEGPLLRAVEIPSIEPAKDGWVGFSTITGQQWTDFCAMIGQQDVAEDPLYLDGRARMEQLAFMQEIVHSWTRERTVDEIVELSLMFRIPVAPVGNGKTLPEMDHFKARGTFQQSAGGFLQPRPHYILHSSELRPLGSSPALGEHSEEVIAALQGATERSSETLEGDPLPLSGLRVVDLSAFWAGPIASCFMADMGADVVKIESIHRPDGMRFAGARPGDQMWEWSPVFAGANPGKRDITLQLDNEEGLALLKRLISEADIVIENYSPRVLENFGLGWDDMRALNSRLIMLRMPAFGLDGPWRDRPGFAMTIEQVSGLAWMTGYHDLPLVIRGACDPIGGMHAIFALLAALEHRRRTGEGQLVEVPLAEVALNVAAEQVMEYSANGVLLSRDENRGPAAAPQGVYGCREDGELALAVPSDEVWQALCGVLGNPAWALDARMSSCAGRREHHDEIDEQLEAFFANQDLEAAVESLLAAGIPTSPVINAHYVMPNPQLEHRQFFQNMTHPVTGDTRYPGFPLNFSALGSRLHPAPPPTLGQNNEEILAEELGLSDDEIEALREKQVIGNRPSFM